MGVGAQGILGEFQRIRLSPCRIRAAGGDDLGESGSRCIGDALREIHLPAIGSEAAGTLVVGGVEARGDGFRFAPFSLVILFRKEDVACLGAGDSAEFIALRLVAGRGEIELVGLIAQKHRRIIVSSGVEYIHLLHLISASFLLPGRGELC